MSIFNKIFPRLSQIPELAAIESAGEIKRVINLCKWKMISHWQYWLFLLLLIPISFLLPLIIGFWYINLDIKVCNQYLMAFLALMSLIMYICIILIAQLNKIYFMSPHIIAVLSSRVDSDDILSIHNTHQALRKITLKRGLWLLLACFLLIICIGVPLATSTDFEDYTPCPSPAELTSPRVVKDDIGLSKNVLIEDRRIGHVSDITVVNSSNDNNRETVITGNKGALFIDGSGNAKFIQFAARQDHVDYIRLNRQGYYGFMNRGAWCGNARVMNQDGEQLWEYTIGSNGIDDMASGDLDDDGKPEYVVGFNGGGGVHLLDSNGIKLWEQPDGNVWHVEIADIYGDGHRMIVHSNAAGQIKVRDINGNVVSKTSSTPFISPYCSDFHLIRWPDSTSPERVLLAEKEYIWILDTNANIMAKFPAPDSGDLGDARGVLVNLDSNKQVLATIVDYQNWDRSILYIHDMSGNLLYQEIIAESCPSIAVFPNEGFVIGGEGRLIEYHLK